MLVSNQPRPARDIRVADLVFDKQLHLRHVEIEAACRRVGPRSAHGSMRVDSGGRGQPPENGVEGH